MKRADGNPTGESTKGLNVDSTVYRDYFELANVLMVSIARDENIIEINPKGCEILGYSREEIVGRNWFDLCIPQEMREPVKAVFNQIMSGDKETMAYFENPVVTKSGEQRIIAWHNSYKRDAQGKIVCTLSAGDDITDRKRAEIEKDRIFNFSLDMLCVAGFDGYFKQVNPAWTKTLGWEKEELLTRPWIDFVHPEDVEATVNARTVLVGGQPVTCFEHRYRCKDGSYRWFSWNAFPLPDESLIFAVARDITEDKKLTERLRHSEKMEAIGKLAGGVAHDFNNQLASIMGCADLLHNELRDNPLLRTYANNIITAAEYSAGLTEQLLAFARKCKYQITDVDMHHLVSEAVSMLRRSIDKQIRVEMQLDASKMTVIGDASQLQNALLNLGINARDAMPKGGTIRFSTQTVHLSGPDCDVLSGSLCPGDYLKVSVQDSGLGMDEETKAHLFEPFFTTKEKGTGLGLAAVYGTVEHHKGAIAVHSVPAQGSVFSVFLPIAGEQAAEVSETADKSGGNAAETKQHRILVVDDEEVVLDTVGVMLKAMNHEVIACSSGEAALDIYEKEHDSIDLIVLDLIMPGWNGEKTYRELKRVNPKVSVLLSSGYSIDGEAQQLLDEGVRAFIQKPFRMKKLRDTLSEILEA